jgi:hypothetical protein
MFSLIRLYFGSDCRHYFVHEGNVWRCTMCGATR